MKTTNDRTITHVVQSKRHYDSDRLWDDVHRGYFPTAEDAIRRAEALHTENDRDDHRVIFRGNVIWES